MRSGQRLCWRSVGLLSAALVLLGARDLTGQTLVSFPSPDGGTVYGDLRGTGDRIVIFAHGGQFTKDSWAGQAELLAERGFQTLAIDMRGRGQSRGGTGAELDQDSWHLDVMGAISFARRLGVGSVSLVGASWGGWAAARASVELGAGAIDRLILLAHSPIREPERMHGSKLFITTRDDFSGNGTPRLPGIRDQFERAAEPKELVILDGSGHAQHVFGTEQGPQLWSEIVRFLDGAAPR